MKNNIYLEIIDQEIHHHVWLSFSSISRALSDYSDFIDLMSNNPDANFDIEKANDILLKMSNTMGMIKDIMSCNFNPTK